MDHVSKLKFSKPEIPRDAMYAEKYYPNGLGVKVTNCGICLFGNPDLYSAKVVFKDERWAKTVAQYNKEFRVLLGRMERSKLNDLLGYVMESEVTVLEENGAKT